MKSKLLYKMRCPSGKHEDSTPSCAVYADGSGYCFSCNSYFSKLAENKVTSEVVEKPEDLQEKLAYVRSLPTQTIRGLVLPYDNIGYYITWPDGSYYKCRSWLPSSDRVRYLSPRGHSQPPLVLPGNTLTAIIIEGELNALSLRKAGIPDTIISPGSAGQFTATPMRNYLPALKQYARLIVIADNDKPGAEAVINLSRLLMSNTQALVIRKLMEPDANEVLEHEGEEKLRQKAKDLGV